MESAAYCAARLQVLHDISQPNEGLYSVRDPIENRLTYVRWQMDNILADPAIKVSMLGNRARPRFLLSFFWHCQHAGLQLLRAIKVSMLGNHARPRSRCVSLGWPTRRAASCRVRTPDLVRAAPSRSCALHHHDVPACLPGCQHKMWPSHETQQIIISCEEACAVRMCAVRMLRPQVLGSSEYNAPHLTCRG
jgi:hypothetical protein